MPKFQKGHPRYGGRQKGVLTRGQVDIQRLARELVTDPIYLANLRTRLRSGKCSPQVEAKLFAYAFGEPPQHVEVGGSLRGVVQVVHEHVANIGPVEPTPTLTANVPTASVQKAYITPSSRIELLLD
jgi:hypothetical protein